MILLIFNSLSRKRIRDFRQIENRSIDQETRRVCVRVCGRRTATPRRVTQLGLRACRLLRVQNWEDVCLLARPWNIPLLLTGTVKWVLYHRLMWRHLLGALVLSDINLRNSGFNFHVLVWCSSLNRFHTRDSVVGGKLFFSGGGCAAQMVVVRLAAVLKLYSTWQKITCRLWEH